MEEEREAHPFLKITPPPTSQSPGDMGGICVARLTNVGFYTFTGKSDVNIPVCLATKKKKKENPGHLGVLEVGDHNS